jgi:hypothetical protein
MEETQVAPVTPEAVRVETWRLEVLLQAGYPGPLAELIATSPVDLHQAVRIVEQGCPPRLAAEILL